MHLREHGQLACAVPFTARVFGRAVVMPNLRAPVRTVAEAAAYRHRVLAARPEGSSFQPLMTLYLTGAWWARVAANDSRMRRRDAAVRDTRSTGVRLRGGLQVLPRGRHHQQRERGDGPVEGANAPPAIKSRSAPSRTAAQLRPVLEAMAACGMPLLVHGEVTTPSVDVFDREAAFIDTVLRPLLASLPALRVVMEHITTQQAVEFVRSVPCGRLAATVTPQHMLLSRNALFRGGLRPHLYCLPVLKREVHRAAVAAAATSGDPRFFLGTDSAPHARSAKESACGCAGVFSAHAALPLYAAAFEAAGALEFLEGFASRFGADFYRLPRSTDTITLRRQPWRVPDAYPLGDGEVVPYAAGEELAWAVSD